MYIVSFYSYKGGVGRTVSLLNTAWALAERGRRVALLDLDLEAPGLSSAPLFKHQDGWVEPEFDRGFGGLAEHFKIHQNFPEKWTDKYLLQGLGPGGRIGLMPAENSSSEDAGYTRFIHEFSWSEFYNEKRGQDFMESLVEGIAGEGFDYLFLDARTGLTDVAGITLLHLPDLAVLFTNLSGQSSAGISRQLQNMQGHNKTCMDEGGNPYRRKDAEKQPIEILVVASPLIRGEWKERQWRIEEMEEEFDRPIDIQVDHLPFLSIHEDHQILAQHQPKRDKERAFSRAGDLLASAALPFEQLADEIVRRNPKDPENPVFDARRLLGMGLWRQAVAHYREAINRASSTKRKNIFGSDKAISKDSLEEIWILKVSLEKIRAQHVGLSPHKDRDELVALEKEWFPDERRNADNPEALFELGRSWLALSFPFMLLNESEEVGRCTKNALDYLRQLEGKNKNYPQIQDILALTMLQHGDALTLVGKWKEAKKITEDAIKVYQKLQSRLLLQGLSLTQAVHIGIKLEDFQTAQSWLNEAEKVAEKLDNPHLEANVSLANALVLHEQGKGKAAHEAMEEARELFEKDNDLVGAVNVVTAMATAGWPLPSSPDKNKDLLSWWKDLAAKQLRMPAQARRMALSDFGLGILKGQKNEQYPRMLLRILTDLPVYRTDSSPVGWVKQLIENRESSREQDTELQSLVWIEGCKYLLSSPEKFRDEEEAEILKAATSLLDGVQERLEQEQEENTGICAIQVDAAHQFQLLNALLAFAKKTEDESTLAELKQRANSLDNAPLRRLHVLIVTAMLDGDNSAVLKQAVEIVKEFESPQDWPWDFPLAFLRRTKISRLRDAWKEIESELQQYLPQDGVYPDAA